MQDSIVHWRTTAPTSQQLIAWGQLWTRLLGQVEVGEEKQKPQEVSPGAQNVAAVASGSHSVSEYTNDSGVSPEST